QFEVDNGLEVVDAEVPTNYEIGARTEWADGRLFIDVTAFLTEFEDYQLSVFDPDTNSSGLRNAANLETKGIEANFSALVTDNLTLNGAITLMDATYDSFPNGPCYPGQGVAGGCDDNDNSGTQNTPDTQDLAGAPLENAPDLSYSFSANYTRPITATGWEFFANGTLLYQDDVQYNVNQDPGAADDSYTRVNAALGFTSPDDRWKVSLFAKNLFDEEYALRVLSAGSDDLGGSNQFLPYDYARVLGLRLDLSL
ncbi:MAG: TonB-dependent receptor, partial [Pseudomonadota bacterium]